MTGYTLMHEHTTIDLSGVKQDADCRLDCYEQTREEYRHLYELGVRRIVDVTNDGMGRNPEYIARMEQGARLFPLCNPPAFKRALSARACLSADRFRIG